MNQTETSQRKKKFERPKLDRATRLRRQKMFFIAPVILSFIATVSALFFGGRFVQSFDKDNLQPSISVVIPPDELTVPGGATGKVASPELDSKRIDYEARFLAGGCRPDTGLFPADCGTLFGSEKKDRLNFTKVAPKADEVYLFEKVNLMKSLESARSSSQNPNAELVLNFGESYGDIQVWLDGKAVGHTSRYLHAYEKTLPVAMVEAIVIPHSAIRTDGGLQDLVIKVGLNPDVYTRKSWRLHKVTLTEKSNFLAIEFLTASFVFLTVGGTFLFGIYFMAIWARRKDAAHFGFMIFCYAFSLYIAFLSNVVSYTGLEAATIQKCRLLFIHVMPAPFFLFRFIAELPISIVYSEFKAKKAAKSRGIPYVREKESERSKIMNVVLYYTEFTSIVLPPVFSAVVLALPIAAATNFVYAASVPLTLLTYFGIFTLLLNWGIKESQVRDISFAIPFAMGVAMFLATVITGLLAASGVNVFTISSGGYTGLFVVMLGAISLGNQFTMVYKNLAKVKSRLELLLLGAKELSTAREKLSAVGGAIEYLKQALNTEGHFNADVILQSAGHGSLDSLKTDKFVTARVVENGVSQSNPKFSNCDESNLTSMFDAAQKRTAVLTENHELFIPIMKGDELNGFVKIDNYAEKSLRSDEEHFINALSSSLAIALDNIHHTTNLQALVDEKTQDLQKAFVVVSEEKRKVQDILENMQQGIMTFDSKLEIGQEFSTYVADFYHVPKDTVAGSNVLKFVLPHTKESANTINQTEETLKASVGEHVMNWETNSDHLIHEARIETPDGEKIIALDWHAITDSSDTVEKVMLSVRDLTKQYELEKEVQKERAGNNRMMSAIGEILKVKRQTAKTFIEDASAREKTVFAELKNDPIDLKKVFVELHTVKGGARSLGLQSLMDAVHIAEDSVQQKRQGVDVSTELLQTLVQHVADEITFYKKVIVDVLGGGRVEETSEDSGETENSTSENSLSGALNNLIPMLRKTLEKGGCTLAEITCSDEVVAWSPEGYATVSNIVMHALNNSVDHGYVLPLGRKDPKAVLEARFNINASFTDDNFVKLVICDEGAGFNLEKIKSMARKFGKNPDIMKDDELLQILFEDGASTAEQVTTSSGRGVGLSAIGHFARELKGSARMGYNAQRGARLEVLIPREKAVTLLIPVDEKNFKAA